jgi:hypothetical protein
MARIQQQSVALIWPKFFLGQLVTKRVTCNSNLFQTLPTYFLLNLNTLTVAGRFDYLNQI